MATTFRIKRFSTYNPGDLVIVDRLNGLYLHYAVVLDKFGTVIEYHTDSIIRPKNTLVRLNTIEKMTHGNPFHFEKPLVKVNPKELKERAMKLLGNTNGEYNVITNNCEHFARYLVNGDRKSTLVINFKLKHSWAPYKI